MKYGRLLFSRSAFSPSVCNVGDIAQIFAIDLVYKEMGISKENIVDISNDELSTYRGEKVVLPLNGYFRYSQKYPAFPTSPDIIPIFLGIYAPSKQYLNYSQFWNCHAPIGCRDEATYLAMKRHGYNAYLTGCMTMLFPRRERQPDSPHIFIVDAHPSVFDYIPEELKSHAEYVTHELLVEPSIDANKWAYRCEEETRKLYQRYWNEATLIVTSRLHCAAPCIAMGIPTILVKDSFDERFGWLDKFIHLYSKDEFNSIDWYPAPIDLEAHKKALLQYAVSMISQNPDLNLLQKIHTFYMSRQKKKLGAPILVKGYMYLSQYSPSLANFLRDKVLTRLSIAPKKI